MKILANTRRIIDLFHGAEFLSKSGVPCTL